MHLKFRYYFVYLATYRLACGARWTTFTRSASFSWLSPKTVFSGKTWYTLVSSWTSDAIGSVLTRRSYRARWSRLSRVSFGTSEPLTSTVTSFPSKSLRKKDKKRKIPINN